MSFQINYFNKLIFFTLISLLQVHKVYSFDIIPGVQGSSANLSVSKYNEFGYLEGMRELTPTISIDFFGRSSVEPGFNFNLLAVWEETNFTKQRIRYNYMVTDIVYNPDELKYESISSEEEFDEYLDVGTNISGSYLYFFAPITYDFLSKDNRNEAMRIGYGPALLFMNLSGSAYLTEPCLQNLYDSTGVQPYSNFLPSLLETNCRKVSIETSNIQDIGFAYLFELVFEQIILSVKVLEYELVDKNENKLDLNVASIILSFMF